MKTLYDHKELAKRLPDGPDAIMQVAVAARKSPNTVRKIINEGPATVILSNLSDVAKALGLEVKVTFVPSEGQG